MSADMFVQIPAYRDTELAPTLQDMLAKAARPNRLRIVVAWQHAPDEKLPQSLERDRRIELLRIPFDQSRGCNWARRLLQERWNGERYSLLLDSHHRFVRNWDAKAIKMLEQVRARGVRRPVLSGYLPDYTPGAPDPSEGEPMRVYPLEWEAHVLSRLTGYPLYGWKTLREPVAAAFVSLHFLLTDGSFVRNMPFDPDVYFSGDEGAMSVRLFTHGYHTFHPHRVLGWHAYSRRSRGTHWADHRNWWGQQERSLKRVQRIYEGRLRGALGIGTSRSVGDFEVASLTRLVR